MFLSQNLKQFKKKVSFKEDKGTSIHLLQWIQDYKASWPNFNDILKKKKHLKEKKGNKKGLE